ncbi:hypothetical protein [Mesorhizobium marinum]|uniref:Uncharacterized protein n=1 Tax=Mesorhizobium marinum TaxID=3228790 RepID=A0ABV3R5W0_9HYPH
MFLMLTDTQGREFAVNMINVVKMQEFEGPDGLYTLLWSNAPSGDGVFSMHASERLQRIMQLIQIREGA